MRLKPAIVLSAMLALIVAGAFYWHLAPRPRAADPEALTVFGTSEEALMQPMLQAYRHAHPGVRIAYADMDGTTVYRRVLADLAAGKPGADVVLSTAMDLQVKLVNDGHTLPHHSANGAALPPWARWRDEAFGITFEPAVMVFNRKLMAGRALPRSRAELIDAIGADLPFWKGKVGTYDIRQSGTGYLLTSQDSRQASDSGALFKSFGMARVELAPESGVLLGKVERGDLAVAYNMLSSYARRRQTQGAGIEIVYPRDFTLALLRTAVIPRNAAHPASAHAFLEFLLSTEGQRILAQRAGLNAIREESVPGGADIAQAGLVRPIPLGPGLLVYLDAHKRRRLLENWESLIAEPVP